jgi:hypothetical protein
MLYEVLQLDNARELHPGESRAASQKNMMLPNVVFLVGGEVTQDFRDFCMNSVMSVEAKRRMFFYHGTPMNREVRNHKFQLVFNNYRCVSR